MTFTIARPEAALKAWIFKPPCRGKDLRIYAVTRSFCCKRRQSCPRFCQFSGNNAEVTTKMSHAYPTLLLEIFRKKLGNSEKQKETDNLTAMKNMQPPLLTFSPTCSICFHLKTRFSSSSKAGRLPEVQN